MPGMPPDWATARASAVPAASSSGIRAMVAEDLVQGGLVVPAALGQPLEHEHARHAELPAGVLPVPGAANADRPRRDLTAGQLTAGFHIDNMRGLGEDQAGAEDRAAADPGSADHQAAGSDEGIVA